MNSADESINKAPLPTEKTLKARKNLIFQLFRFVAINIRMVKMIMKGHH
jgi:hypothetical protein